MAYYTEEQLENVRKGLDYAKQYPDDPKSKEIISRLRDGKLNFELKALGLNPVKTKQPQVDLNAIMSSVEQQPGLKSEVPTPGRGFDAMSDLNQGFKELQQVVPTRGTAAMEDIKNMGSFKTFGQGGFGAISQGVGALFDTAGIFAKTAAKVLMRPDQEEKVKGALQAVSENPAIATPIEKVTSAIETIRESDPELANSIGDAFTLTELLGGTSRPVREAVETGIDVGRRTGSATIDTAKKAGESIQSGFETTARTIGQSLDNYTAKKAEVRMAEQAAKVDKAMGRLLQAGSDQKAIDAAKRSLGNIDTSDISTYEELNLKIKDRQTVLVNSLDNYLDETSDFVIRPEQSGVYTSVAGKSVVENPLIDALDGLEEAYSKSGEAVNVEKIRQLKQKFETDGLTLREVNNIARLYGTEYKSLAFTKLGDPKPGFNAQNFESVRSGVKRVIRDRLPDDTAKAIDAEISDLYTVQALTEKMEDKVAKLQQRITERTMAQKVGAAAADLADLASFGTARGFIARMLPSNVGNKAMNSLEIEAELNKNLAELDKMLAIKDDKLFAQRFEQWAKEIQPGLSIRSNVTPLNVGMSLSDTEFDLMADAIPDVRTARLNPDFNEMLTKYGLQNATDDELTSFMKEATDQFERPETSFNQGATPSTNLLEEAKKYKSAEEFVKDMTNRRWTIRKDYPNIVWHETNVKNADEIYKSGFRTGEELGVGEMENAIFAAQKFDGVSYVREGNKGTRLPLDISRLKLAEDVQIGYGSDVIPTGFDGAISYDKNGVINELMLTPEAANKALITRTQLEEIWKQANQ